MVEIPRQKAPFSELVSLVFFNWHKCCLQVIILQCHWRRWLATRYVQKLRHDKELRLEWERQEEIRKQKERDDRIRKEFERRMNPRSKEDFDLLYAALESESSIFNSKTDVHFWIWQPIIRGWRRSFGGVWRQVPQNMTLNRSRMAKLPIFPMIIRIFRWQSLSLFLKPGKSKPGTPPPVSWGPWIIAQYDVGLQSTKVSKGMLLWWNLRAEIFVLFFILSWDG